MKKETTSEQARKNKTIISIKKQLAELIESCLIQAYQEGQIDLLKKQLKI